MLKLNQDKTELIVFRPKHRQCSTGDWAITIGGVNIIGVQCVKNLGVLLDRHLNMEKQVNAISKSCFYQIRNIGQIRRYITNEACKTLVQALITSRLDYANSLLYGIPSSLLGRLQRVQNTAARLVTLTRKRDHITPILKQLHWLPVEYRPQYKILMHTYKALNDMGPLYIKELLGVYRPTRSLRSASRSLLVVPHTRTQTYGCRCFGKSAPQLWNDLPESVKKCEQSSQF